MADVGAVNKAVGEARVKMVPTRSAWVHQFGIKLSAQSDNKLIDLEMIRWLDFYVLIHKTSHDNVKIGCYGHKPEW